MVKTDVEKINMNQKANDQPLDLTVHKMPATGVSAMDTSQTRLGRWKMIAVLFICATPVIASYFTYYVLKPSNTKSFGELVQPQRAMPDVAAITLDGKTTTVQSLRGQWLLVSTSGGACGKACEAHLYMQRQLRETLGKEKERLDWVWLVSDDAPLASELQARLTAPAMQAQGFRALRIKESDVTAWLQSGATRLYLIDPQGNYMMRFPENMTIEQAAKAKADINRLLRASSFWDTPGRDNVKLKK